MKKIAFIWWFDESSKIYKNWRDGLRRALDIINKKKDYSVSYFFDKTLPDKGEFDFLLFWSSTNEDYFEYLNKYKAKKGLCLTTYPTNIDNLREMDVVYCESQPILDEVESYGTETYNVMDEKKGYYVQKTRPFYKSILAFGTDTDFYKPDPKKRKDIPYFYPATFSPWKRQDEIADLASNLYLVGTIQPDGLDIYNKCANKGCNIEVGYFPASKIRNMYQRSKQVVIPAIHGSERTVLEAMATNIKPVVIHPTNKRTYSYIKEFEDSGLETPRKFILKNYSHRIYAKKLLEGIK